MSGTVSRRPRGVLPPAALPRTQPVNALGFIQSNGTMNAWDRQNARFQATDDRARADQVDAAMRRGVEQSLIGSKQGQQGQAPAAAPVAPVTAEPLAPVEDDAPLVPDMGGAPAAPAAPAVAPPGPPTEAAGGMLAKLGEGPSAPSSPMAPVTMPGGGSYGAGSPFQVALRRQESGTDDTARNPRSSAAGRYQFIDSTWRQFSRARPDLFAGMDDAQVMAARSRGDLQDAGAEWYANVNAPELQRAGLPVNRGTLALAHGFGAGGARALLTAPPDTPVETIVGPQVMAANPHLRGQTVGQVVQGFQNRQGAGGSMPMAPTAGGTGAPQRIQTDIPFRELLAEMARTPGAGQAALQLLMRGQQMQGQQNLQQQRLDQQAQLSRERMGMAQGRADQTERRRAEQNAMTALGRGDMETYQYWSQRAGISLPPQVVQNAQLRRNVAAGSLLARRFYQDRQQAQVFAQTYARTGNAEQAFQAAGAPRGADPRFTFRWVQDGEREVLLQLDPTGRGQPSVAQMPGAQPSAPGQGGQDPAGGQSAAPPPAAPGAPLQQVQPPGQPVTRPPRGAQGGQTRDRELRYRFALQSGMSEQEAAAVAAGAALSPNQLANMLQRTQTALGSELGFQRGQREDETAWRQRVEQELDRRMSLFAPDWRQRIGGQRPGRPAAPQRPEPPAATEGPGARPAPSAPATAPTQATPDRIPVQGANGQQVEAVRTGDRAPDGRAIYQMPDGRRFPYPPRARAN